MTQEVIAANGFDDFLPTACYPEQGEIAALQGLPADVEVEPAVADGWLGDVDWSGLLD